MKQFALLTLLIIAGLLAWLFGWRLSPDALGMAAGLVCGVLAGVPTALLVLAAARRRPAQDDDCDDDAPSLYGRNQGMHALPYQPPVVIVTGSAQAQQPAAYPGQQRQLSGPAAAPLQRSERVFKVVGEKEEWLDEEW